MDSLANEFIQSQHVPDYWLEILLAMIKTFSTCDVIESNIHSVTFMHKSIQQPGLSAQGTSGKVAV